MKRIFILALLTFSLIKFTSADAQSQQAFDLNQVKQDKVVQVPGDDGTYRNVEIKEINGVFVGPLGERYYTFPTMHDLQLNYGNISNEQIQASSQDIGLRSQLLLRQGSRHAEEMQEKVDQANKQLEDRIEKGNQAIAAQQKAEQDNSQNSTKVNSTEGGGMGALFFPVILLGILIYFVLVNTIISSRLGRASGTL